MISSEHMLSYFTLFHNVIQYRRVNRETIAGVRIRITVIGIPKPQPCISQAVAEPFGSEDPMTEDKAVLSMKVDVEEVGPTSTPL